MKSKKKMSNQKLSQNLVNKFFLKTSNVFQTTYEITNIYFIYILYNFTKKKIHFFLTF